MVNGRQTERVIIRHSRAFRIQHSLYSRFIIHHSYSPVYFTQHNINRADDRDHVCNQVATHHKVKSLEVHERGRPYPHSVRIGGSVAHHEVTQLALGRFNRVVDLSHGRLDHFADLAHDRPRTKALHRLPDDAHRLTHLLDAHHVPIVGVALLASGDLKVHLVVRFVRLRLAHVPVHAGPA